MINAESIVEFRRVSKLHEDWLVYAIVGSDLLTKGELEAVCLYGLPIDYPLDLTTVSYILGKKAAHSSEKVYKSLSNADITASFSDIEKASVLDLRLRAASEIRQIAQFVSGSIQTRLQDTITTSLEKSLYGENLEKALADQMVQLTKETFSKAFTLFNNVYNLAMLDLIHISKSTALLNSMVYQEGLYTQGLSSQIMVRENDEYLPVTAGDLLDKSLSGLDLFYIPPGTSFIEGKLIVTDRKQFIEPLQKAGIATAKPPGPPQPKTGASNPGSIKGIAAVGNEAGPGRGAGQANAPKKGVEYDDWKPSGSSRPEGPGWEQSTTGGWRHIKGAGGATGPEAPQTVQENLVQQDMDAQHWGRQPKKPIEVINHLGQGKIAALKPLGADEAGVNVAYRVTIDGNGRGLMKPQVDSWDPEVDSELVGSGFGNIEGGTEHNREAAAHRLGALLGSDIVPPTTTRAYGGETHSIQAWAEGHESTGAWLEKRVEEDAWASNNYTELLLNNIPSEHKEAFIEKLNKLCIHDIVMNNNDRHLDNIVIDDDGKSFKAIDHGLAFGVGVKGIRSDFLHGLSKMGKPVKIPPTLQTRLKNTSLGDYQRALGDHLSDWEIGQTYLRSQYVLHLQETEGYVDPAKFQATLDSLSGSNEIPLQNPSEKGWQLDDSWKVGNSEEAGWKNFNQRKEDKTLPNDLFNSWAKKFINDNKNNSESTFHSAAQQLDQIGVFMSSEAMKDPKAFRREGGHKEYEKTIRASNPPSQLTPKKPPVDPIKHNEQVDPLGGTVKDRRRGVERRVAQTKTVAGNKRKGGRRRDD